MDALAFKRRTLLNHRRQASVLAFRKSRRRAVMLAATLATAAQAALPGPVMADDLEHRKHSVERRIDRAQGQLDQSSDALADAGQALAAAERRLDNAEEALGVTRGQLAAAIAVERVARSRLRAAQTALRSARVDVADARARIRGQEVEIRQIAVSTYQSGDPGLLALSMVLSSDDPADLTGQLNSVQNVLAKESAVLDRVEATRSLLIVREQERAAATARVATEQAMAAENVRQRRRLELQARLEQDHVARLVAERAEQRAAAARARAADLLQLRELQRERDRVGALLRRRAEAARKQAAAGARNRAATAAPTGRVLGPGGAMAWPVRGWISSPFGMRWHPVYKRWSLHDGIDIASPCGTPVRAAASGRVVARYYNSAYGNRVLIDNGYQRGAGVATTYNHLSGFSTFVGQDVRQGDVIGYVGTTGASTGCHLHFMVVKNGAATNPIDWL